jgi:hypothetical protein
MTMTLQNVAWALTGRGLMDCLQYYDNCLFFSCFFCFEALYLVRGLCWACSVVKMAVQCLCMQSKRNLVWPSVMSSNFLKDPTNLESLWTNCPVIFFSSRTITNKLVSGFVATWVKKSLCLSPCSTYMKTYFHWSVKLENQWNMVIQFSGCWKSTGDISRVLIITDKISINNFKQISAFHFN